MTGGEEIVIADEGKPVAVILPYTGLVVHDDFDEPLPEFDL